MTATSHTMIHQIVKKTRHTIRSRWKVILHTYFIPPLFPHLSSSPGRLSRTPSGGAFLCINRRRVQRTLVVFLQCPSGTSHDISYETNVSPLLRELPFGLARRLLQKMDLITFTAVVLVAVRNLFSLENIL